MDDRITIVLAEDETRIRQLVRDYLRKDGYTVIEAPNGIDALSRFREHPETDLVILDVMMPGLTGWEVCQEIRQGSDVPILFLTALGTSDDELQGFGTGGDDYVTKPFEYEILMARVRALLKRKQKDMPPRIVIDDIVISPDARNVTKDDEPVDLSPKEMELLLFLLRNRNIALDRDRILDGVWGEDFFGDRRTVDTHVKNLRAKIGLAGERIRTVRGTGYRFEV